MNRIKAIVMAFCMVISLFSMAYAEENHAEVLEDDVRKETILVGIGILSENKTKNTDNSENVESTEITRSEFANAIVMTVNDICPEGRKVCDLSADDGGLLWLIENGFVNGYGNSVFRPNDAITFSEAAKIALTMLGYDAIAEEEGGYPTGYMSQAHKCKLFKGVNTGTDIFDRRSFVNFLYNVIQTDVLKVETLKNGSDGFVYGTYNEKNGCTLLSEMRDIYRYDGLVTATELSGLYSAENKTEKNEIRIGDILFKECGMYNIENSLLGKNVESYYHLDKTETATLLCAVPDRNKEITIQGSNIVSYKDGTYQYMTEKNAKNKTVSIKQDIIVLYNGAYANNNQVFLPKDGKITLLDNNDDGNYEILKIYDTKLIVVEQANEINGNYVIFDKYDKQYNETVTDYHNTVVRIYDVEGTEQPISKITGGISIGIEKSAGDAPGYTIRLLKSTIDRIKSSSEKNVVFSAYGKCESTERFNKLFIDKNVSASYDEEYVIYFTENNRIVSMEKANTDGNPLAFRIGYLHRFTRNETVFEVEPLALIYDESDMWKKCGFARTVEINDVRVKRKDVNLNAETGGLIKYKLNIEGEISEIYFPKQIPNNPSSEKFDDEFQLIFNGNGTYRYYPGGYAIGTEKTIVNVGKDIKLFMVPALSDPSMIEDDMVKITSSNILTDGSNYQFAIYNTNGKAGLGNFGIVKVPAEQWVLDKRDGHPIAVNEVATAIVDDEIVTAIIGMKDGGEVTIYVRDERNGGEIPFQKGDIIYLLSDLNEGVVTLRDDMLNADGSSKGYSYGVLCRRGADGTLQTYTTSNRDLISGKWGVYFGEDNIQHSSRVKAGKVYDASSEYIYVSPQDAPMDWSRVEAFQNINWGYVYVWDEKKEKFRTGSLLDEIACAKYSGENASRVCVVTDNSQQTIVIWP